MNRREFVAGLAGTAAWPLLAVAQGSTRPTIGFLNSQSSSSFGHLAAAFLRGLSQSGFTDGQNVSVEFRWADGQYDRLPEMAADLVRRPVAVLVATGGEPASLAAKAATSTIPIVFALGGDPVKGGFVSNLARPGGHMTGLTQFTEPLEGKRLGLLHELAPKAALGALLNPSFPPFKAQLKALTDAAAQLNVRLIPVMAKDVSA